MAMDNTIDMWEAFVDLAMDEPLLIPLFGIGIHGRTIRYIVMYEI